MILKRTLICTPFCTPFCTPMGCIFSCTPLLYVQCSTPFPLPYLLSLKPYFVSMVISLSLLCFLWS